jgi:photosynthetic reaction center cytochrome c subunit
MMHQGGIEMTTTKLGLLATAVATAALAVSAAAAPAQTAAAPAGPAVAPKAAGEVFKNVHVLKDIPAEELIPTMQFVSASLGVECEFCHVQRAPEKDDKKEKKTARSMMQMVAAINRDNFDGDHEVTCYSCHRGATEPIAVPAVATADAVPETPGAPAAVPALPSAEQLLERYLQALGGADAVKSVTSRVQKGQITGFGGRQSPIEVVAKAPNKRVSVTQMPRGESITAYDGSGGWLTGREGPHPMTAAEAEAARLDADLYFPLHVKQVFTGFRVQPSEKIDDREAVLLVAAREGKPPVRLYFDAQSGLLVRQVRYAETALGNLPTQIDYADYRDVDGVKVPFRWTLARPSGRFTIQIETTQQNVAVDDARFVMPAPPAAPPPQPK